MLWNIFKHFIEFASFSYNRSNALFLLYDFLKYTTIKFKNVFISLDMSLQGPTFVASIAAKFAPCATQWTYIKKEFTFSFKCAATPFYLPIIVDAPSDQNPTYLLKSSSYFFTLFLIKVSNIMHASFFPLQYATIQEKCKEEDLPL